MELTEFQVRNYRSVIDSGPIGVTNLTAIFGQNESGKSNLLRALYYLNPENEIANFDEVRDFPRKGNHEENFLETVFISTTWKLSEKEKDELNKFWPHGEYVSKIKIEKNFGSELKIQIIPTDSLFLEKKFIEFVSHMILLYIYRFEKSSGISAEKAIHTKIKNWFDSLNLPQDRITFVEHMQKSAVGLRSEIISWFNKYDDPDNFKHDIIAKINELVYFDSIDFSKGYEIPGFIEKWIKGKLPKFIYLENIPVFDGELNIGEPDVNEDKYIIFEKLCNIINISNKDIFELRDNYSRNSENRLFRRANNVFTHEIQRIWKNRKLSVKFGIDSKKFITIIFDPHDPNGINLNERSVGFKWLFSLYVSIANVFMNKESDEFILLLEEPGMSLHASAQQGLLNYLDKEIESQVIYTSHSPFMIPFSKQDQVRLVKTDDELCTKVSNLKIADNKSHIPLQTALGRELALDLIFKPKSLIVEGTTDFLTLRLMSDFLESKGKICLDREIAIIPAGSSSNIKLYISILLSNELNFLALFDSEHNARQQGNNLLQEKNVEERNILYVSSAFKSNGQRDADMEDLFGDVLYSDLVYESHKDVIGDVALEFDETEKRIAKKFSRALSKIHEKLDKTLVVNLLKCKLDTNSDNLITEEIVSRFERLFKLINGKLE